MGEDDFERVCAWQRGREVLISARLALMLHDTNETGERLPEALSGMTKMQAEGPRVLRRDGFRDAPPPHAAHFRQSAAVTSTSASL